MGLIKLIAPAANLSRVIVAIVVFALTCVMSAKARALTNQGPRQITDYGASVWQQSEGLPDNSLRAILQTRDGYLWIGTKGGLARFNGISFQVYSARTPGQLGDSEVRALVEGDDGSLYIGTMRGGLSVLKNGVFTTLRKKDGLADDVVRALCRGRDGAIWIGTDGGVNRLRNGKLATFDEKAGLLAPGVLALREDDQGRIWVGTRKGLFIIDGERVLDRSRDEAVRDAQISAMAFDLEGRLWVATAERKLFRAEGDSFAVMPAELTPEGRIETLFVDAFGHVWLGTIDGAYRLMDGKLEQYPRFVSSRTKERYVEAIPISAIWAITSDREGNVWLGSSESGLVRLRRGRFQRITANDGLPSPWVDSLVESAEGALYVGTLGGLARVQGDQVVTVSFESGAKTCAVEALARGDDDVIWVGSECGIFFGNGDQFTKYPVSTPRERIHAIARTRDGNLWLGYPVSGLLRVTPGGELRWFTTKDGLLSNKIRTVAEEADGTLLVGTLDGGLSQIRGDQVTTPKASGTDAVTATYHTMLASDGNSWFATRRGLVRRKHGKDVLLPAEHGMPPVEFFFKIIEDSSAQLWLTSNVGVFRIPLAELNALADGQDKNVGFAWFTNEDGMPSAACSQTSPNAAIRCRAGKLCFATSGGVAIVDPERVSPSQYAPAVHIESVRFDRAPVEMASKVVLGPGRNDIEFNYAGLEFAFPSRVYFRYRLKGWDQAWSEPVERRTARYTNLSPGEYRFEVEARNSDGVWNHAAARFDFGIAPRFYQTKAFYALSGLALLGLVAIVIRARTRRLKLRTIQLEQLVQKRTEAVAQRNQDMRLVLDNVGQGFLTIDAHGKLALERSAIVDRWFGAYPPETRFVTFMQGVDPGFAEHFKCGFDQLAEDVLPVQLAVDQLPKRIKCTGSEYACAYTPLFKDEEFNGLLVVINDVTSELLHERQQAERSELLAMFESLTKDRSGFLTFFDDASETIGHLAEAELDAQKRMLHTLKGNAGIMALGVVASTCHQLEDELANSCSPLTAEALSPLKERWAQLSESLRSFVGDSGRDVIQLRLRDLELLAEEVRTGVSQAYLLDRLGSWWLEDTERPLSRLGRYASGLAARLGKGDLQIEIQAHGVRLSPKAWAGFWSELVHVVRNAVDHGLESPYERWQAGKAQLPRLRLSTCVKEHKLRVEIEDNGGGVDWGAVRRAAAKLNLPSETDGDLVNCLFASGLTTRDEVTSLSGRGVGLAAVRHQVEELGGTIAVITNPSAGTCVRFEFPLPQLGPRFGVDPGDARC